MIDLDLLFGSWFKGSYWNSVSLELLKGEFWCECICQKRQIREECWLILCLKMSVGSIWFLKLFTAGDLIGSFTTWELLSCSHRIIWLLRNFCLEVDPLTSDPIVALIYLREWLMFEDLSVAINLSRQIHWHKMIGNFFFLIIFTCVKSGSVILTLFKLLRKAWIERTSLVLGKFGICHS